MKSAFCETAKRQREIILGPVVYGLKSGSFPVMVLKAYGKPIGIQQEFKRNPIGIRQEFEIQWEFLVT